MRYSSLLFYKLLQAIIICAVYFVFTEEWRNIAVCASAPTLNWSLFKIKENEKICIISDPSARMSNVMVPAFMFLLESIDFPRIK